MSQAKMLPQVIRTHAIHHTAPSWLLEKKHNIYFLVIGGVNQSQSWGKRGLYPFNVSSSLWESPSTSKILIVLSDEHVASLRP